MSDRPIDEQRIIEAQLTGQLPDFYTSRHAVETWRKMKEIAQIIRYDCAEATSYGSGWTADRAREMGKSVWRFEIQKDA